MKPRIQHQQGENGRPEPKTIATLLSRATGQRGAPAGKGRGFPAAKGKDKRHPVSNELQSLRRSGRGRKHAT